MDKKDKKRILFVDDEQKVLEGLRRMLHSKHQEWDMEFVNSGKEALKLMKEHPVDLIISDMRMPEMDGAELLKIIKKFYPQTIRFILSGYSDKEMILRTLGSTEQFLTKPCNAGTLKEAISKALESYELIDDNQTRAFVSKIESLPTMPDLFQQLKLLLESPTSSFKDIAKVISKDISMTAKILHLVNSSFFGLRQKIHNIQYATTYLGIETIRAIILLTEVFNTFTKDELDKFAIKKLYKHSIAMGALTTEIMKTISTDRKFTDKTCMAGMLHDIGKLIIIRDKPKEYEEIFRRCDKEGVPLYMLEKEYFGTTHAELGGSLMDLWNLPDNVVKAITYHHMPSQSPLDTSFSMLLAVHVSNSLQHEPSNRTKRGASSQIDKKYLSELGMLEYLPEWRKIARNLSENRYSRSA